MAELAPMLENARKHAYRAIGEPVEGTLLTVMTSVAESARDSAEAGDSVENAGIIRAILGGTERGPKRDAVLLNAGHALFVAEKTNSALEGWELAAEVIDGGKARTKLGELAVSD